MELSDFHIIWIFHILISSSYLTAGQVFLAMNVYTASTVQFVITIALLNTESKATIPDPKPGVAEKTPDQGKAMQRFVSDL